jgi:hypothetical protein
MKKFGAVAILVTLAVAGIADAQSGGLPANRTTMSNRTMSRYCGAFDSHGHQERVRVSVVGPVSCRRAIIVMRDSFAGKGKMLGLGLAQGTETDGWMCSYGMGSRLCQRGAASITGTF